MTTSETVKPIEKRLTIKQATTYLGLSKNTIMYRLSKLPDDVKVKENGRIYILKEGIDALRELSEQMDNIVVEAIDKDTAPADAEPVKDQTDLVNELRRTIALLSDQIEKKDHQIEELNTSLKREQEISLHNSLLLKEREEQIIRLEADTKKSWFSRHFGRKNSTKQLN